MTCGVTESQMMAATRAQPAATEKMRGLLIRRS
jgi:hypothetical protein